MLPDTGKRVAVAGAGPAGVAGAVTLASFGHRVTLLERAESPGQRWPGTRFRRNGCRTRSCRRNGRRCGFYWSHRTAQLLVGHGRTLDDILNEGFDAVLLAPGLSRSLTLPDSVQPESGVEGALDFLRQVKHERGRKVSGTVLVLGGGNTAIDAALSARRAGADDVIDPLPPVVRRDAGLAERARRGDAGGVKFLILTQPVRYRIDTGGKLTGVEVVRTKLGSPDASGRRRPEIRPGRST
ncbi:MAG: FAD-dependent oxidoreductase [Paludibaculum sp.]